MDYMHRAQRTYSKVGTTARHQSAQKQQRFALLQQCAQRAAHQNIRLIIVTITTM